MVAVHLRPVMNRDDEFYWEGTREQKLLLQECAGCGRVRHPPTPTCPWCRSLEVSLRPSVGRGEVFSFIVPRYPEFPGFGAGYVVALVELEEGVRMIANVRGVEPSEVAVGMPVRLIWEQMEDGYWLPQFEPALPGAAPAP